MKIRILIFAICFLIFLVLINKNTVSLWIEGFTKKVVVTNNKDSNRIKDLLNKHIKHMTLKEGKVHVVFNGFLDIKPTFGGGLGQCRLNVSDEFSGPRDHHSWMKFKLLKIYADGVDIGYESGFNHSSFGKNLITLDRGVIHLQWKN